MCACVEIELEATNHPNPVLQLRDHGCHQVRSTVGELHGQGERQVGEIGKKLLSYTTPGKAPEATANPQGSERGDTDWMGAIMCAWQMPDVH